MTHRDNALIIITWLLLTIWQGLKATWEHRRGVIWAALIVWATHAAWTHRTRIAAEYGRLQGVVEAERDKARQSGQVAAEDQRAVREMR